MTTNHIDNALELCCNELKLACREVLRPILTELVEAVTAEEREGRLLVVDRLAASNQAKLAEVRAEAFEARRTHATEVGTDNYYEGQYDLACAFLAILDKEAL